MNDLSWMIYAADVVGSLSGLAGGVAVMTGIGGFVSGIILIVASGDTPTFFSFDDKEDRVRKLAAHTARQAAFAKAVKIAAIMCAISAVLACVLPSRGTMYAIAASQVGEDVIASETGDKAVKALNAWLDKQISEAAK